MIRTLITFFLGLELVHGGLNKPHITVNLQNGLASGIEALDPTLSWSSSASALDCDFEMGGDVAIKPTVDVLSLPRSIWAKVSKEMMGWGLSSRVSVDVQQAGSLDLDISAKNSDFDTSVKLNSSGGSLKMLDVAKGFEVPGGRFTFNPRYNFKDSTPDISLDYDRGSTLVTLEASMASQKVIVSHEVAEGHRIIPSFTADGDMSIGYERTTDFGSISTTVKPNESVVVKWNDGPWTALIEAPLDGFSTSGINVSMKRKVTFL